jgi:hypothetical protein
MRRMRRALFGGRRSRRILGPILGPGLQRLRLAHARREAGDYRTAADEFHALAERGAGIAIGPGLVLAGSYLLGQHSPVSPTCSEACRLRCAGQPPLAAASTSPDGPMVGQEADAFLGISFGWPAAAGSAASAGPAHVAPVPPSARPAETIHPAEWVDPDPLPAILRVGGRPKGLAARWPPPV